jgi:hypothetical protein
MSDLIEQVENLTGFLPGEIRQAQVWEDFQRDGWYIDVKLIDSSWEPRFFIPNQDLYDEHRS